MPVAIRQIVGKSFTHHTDLAGDSWDLREQMETLQEWMSNNTLDPSSEWIADIGFTTRLNATGGGPAINRELMQLCLASNLEIFLSEYGTESDRSQ